MGTPDFSQMMQQVQQMQSQMVASQEQLAAEEFEVTSGGGIVKLKLNGALEFKSIEIDPEALNADDREILQDALVTAVNDAIAQVGEKSQQQLGQVTGGIDLSSLGLGL